MFPSVIFYFQPHQSNYRPVNRRLVVLMPFVRNSSVPDPVLAYQIMSAILTKDVGQNAWSIRIAYLFLLAYNQSAETHALVSVDNSLNVKLSIIDHLAHAFPVIAATPSNTAL